jgi:outer membrane protein assembly factor BamB
MVRDAVVIGPGSRVYFGDLESIFYALDANTGKLIWQKKLDDQAFTRITGTAKLYDGRLYVPIASQEENAGANPFYSCCTFRGNIVAMKASDGSVIWKSFTSPEAKPTWKSATGIQYYGPSGATIWSSPTLDLKRKLLYVATGNGYSDPEIKTADAIVAMDMETGAIRWTQQAARTCSIGIVAGAARKDRRRETVPKKPGEMWISAPRQFWWILTAATNCLSLVRSREWSGDSIRMSKGRWSGRRASAKGARAVEFNGELHTALSIDLSSRRWPTRCATIHFPEADSSP